MIEFQSGSSYFGFLLKQKEYIKEIDSTVYLFHHEVLGTPVIAIKNKDENKTFNIAFQTIPHDSTGVAHILEHSVLMGSEKYPVKDVFGEINKGGLMTFLNAMTGSDATWYPFATRNLKEYFNIMDVYCDVTLNPLLAKDTFEQEGWHYHKEDKDQEIQFQGVVYNEMKGAFSDPIRSIFHHTFGGLMPGSTYAHESGGDPKNIPDLSHEEFVEFHKNHYHPSNSTIFFYGNAPLEKELQFIQDHFLAKYDSSNEIAKIEQGKDINKSVVIDDTYGVQPGSDLSGKTFHAVGSSIGNVLQRKRNTAFRIIAHILYNSDASPLKKTILSAGLCKDFGGLFLPSSSYKTIMMTYLIGSEPEHKEHFQSLYKKTLEKMVNETLDKDLILSELNKYEFSAREEMIKAQRGLDLFGKAMPAMKHGSDPFESLCVDALFTDIRKDALENNYFEKLIKKYLLENPASVTVTLKPDQGKILANLQEEKKRLSDYENSLSTEELEQLVKNTHQLQEQQLKPNDEQTLKLLPQLSANDLEHSVDFLEVQTRELHGRPFLVNELDTNSIAYMDFGLNCSGLSARHLTFLNLFATIVTEIGTKDKDYMQFAKELNICTGGLNHSFNTHLNRNNKDVFQPVLWFHVKALSGYLDRALNLVSEIFAKVDFADHVHIREIVQREFAWAEHSAQSEGYGLATSRVFAQLGTAGLYNDYVSGMTSYQTLKELSLNYDAQEDEFINVLREIQSLLFNREALQLSLTSDSKIMYKFEQGQQVIMDSLGNQPLQTVTPDFESFAANEAFTTSSEVVYNIQGCNIFPDTSHYNGHFDILKTWLSRDYLWNTVRQAGGAYGCFIQFNQLSGNFALVSYRDPQVKKTYEAYDSIAKRISSLDLSQQVLQQLIVGAYGNFNPHQGPAAKGATAKNEYIAGITPEYKQKCLEQILSTTVQDLKDFAPLFNNLCSHSFKSTIGNKEKIHSDKNLFDSISEI